nr:MAG TPA: Flagellar and Swarming motility protein [Caudoviricetes sp.]
MFKVHEKFKDREVWVRLREIMQVYPMEDGDYTAIKFKNGDHMYVTESVEEILEAIGIEWHMSKK